MNWEKKYAWRRTWPDDRDRYGNPLEDYVAYDGRQYVGRIYLDEQNLKAGTWRWCGSYPMGFRTAIMPNNGWKPTAAEAAQTVEWYWDEMLNRIAAEQE